eukprot:jgi/Astpho2/3719/Aster-x1166
MQPQAGGSTALHQMHLGTAHDELLVYNIKCQLQYSAAQPPPRDSPDPDSEDAQLLEEFQLRVDPHRFQRMRSHLDLLVDLQQQRRPELCACCEGAALESCSWCRGTGAMMVGEERFCSIATGCKQCPICNGKGQVKCKHCKGTGMRAGWMEPGCPA